MQLTHPAFPIFETINKFLDPLLKDREYHLSLFGRWLEWNLRIRGIYDRIGRVRSSWLLKTMADCLSRRMDKYPLFQWKSHCVTRKWCELRRWTRNWSFTLTNIIIKQKYIDKQSTTSWALKIEDKMHLPHLTTSNSELIIPESSIL